MIDIHSHINYGIDDGPVNIDSSIDIIRKAKSVGIDEIFLTSHFIEDAYRVESKVYLEHIDELKKRLKHENVDVKLYVGNEVMISPNILDYIENNEIFLLNNSKYLLFELPLNEEIINLNDFVDELILKGFIPIIAHPERYSYFESDNSKIKTLFDKGVLFQLNAGSIIGLYGIKAQKLAKYLLKNKMAHFIASDAHSPHRVFDRYPEILKKLESLVGDENLNILTHTNPEIVKNNLDGIFKLSEYKTARWRWW